MILLPCWSWRDWSGSGSGARQAKAGRIIAIDTNPKKFDLARRFGATDCINPNDYDKPIKDVLLDINKWGIDHTFECIGNVNVIACSALESAHRAGVSR